MGARYICRYAQYRAQPEPSGHNGLPACRHEGISEYRDVPYRTSADRTCTPRMLVLYALSGVMVRHGTPVQMYKNQCQVRWCRGGMFGVQRRGTRGVAVSLGAVLQSLPLHGTTHGTGKPRTSDALSTHQPMALQVHPPSAPIAPLAHSRPRLHPPPSPCPSLPLNSPWSPWLVYGSLHAGFRILPCK